MKTSTFLVYAGLGTLGAMAACSSSNSGGNGNGTAGTTTSTTTAGPTTSTSSGGTASTTTAASSTTMAAGGTSTTTMTRSCDNPAGMNSTSLTADEAGIPGSPATYDYGDSVSTHCLESGGTPNNVCLYGLGADSDDGMGNMYANWGAGLGVLMADTEEDGTVNAPWDAAALGIASVQFTISNVTGHAPVRFGISMVDQTFGDVTIPFSQQPFVNGKDSANDIKTDGTYTVPFDMMFLPSWTSYMDQCTGNTYCAFNPAQIHSVQFQIVTAPGATSPYDFCVSDLTWLDASGNPVDVPVPATGAGGAGGQTGM